MSVHKARTATPLRPVARCVLLATFALPTLLCPRSVLREHSLQEVLMHALHVHVLTSAQSRSQFLDALCTITLMQTTLNATLVLLVRPVSFQTWTQRHAPEGTTLIHLILHAKLVLSGTSVQKAALSQQNVLQALTLVL